MKKRLLAFTLALSVFAGFNSFDTSVFATETNTELTYSQSISRWSYTETQTVYEHNGELYLLDASTGAVNVYKVSSAGAKTLVKSFDYKLPVYGGFYYGNEYNYIVFGQNNNDEIDSVVTYQIVKYDRNFNEVSSVSITGGDTITAEPFRAGSLRMDENGDELTVHTSRGMYKSSDGFSHQAQITIVINTKSMTKTNVTNVMQGSQHVSHSFNQFVKYDDDGTQILVDLGDAYPRSVVLSKRIDDSPGISVWSTHKKYDLFNIPGATGANCTGVTIGGFEISSSNYLVATNTVDHSLVTTYTSYKMEGLDTDERDVLLLVTDKNTLQTKEIYFTDYVSKNKSASTPKLVDLENDTFMLLWAEYDVVSTYNSPANSTKYVIIDADGNKISPIGSLGNTPISSVCQPILYNGNVTWVTSGNLYSIETLGSFKITSDMVSSTLTQSYTGSAITPDFTVNYNGISLVNDRDFTVSYSNNTEIGTATATISGLGIFGGTVNSTFKIKLLPTVSTLGNVTTYTYSTGVVIKEEADVYTITGVTSKNNTFVIPMSSEPAYGVVAYDENDVLIKTCSPDEDGLKITLDGDATIKLVDESKTFSDVKSSDWYKNAIDFVTARGLFSGSSTTKFSPNDTMTRSMIWTVLYRYSGDTVQTDGTDWYSAQQEWSILNGISDGTDPLGEMTREQLATLLYRFDGENKTTTDFISGFSDKSQVSSYAVDALNWAISEGLITGKTSTTVAPKANATRAEVATILMRYISR